MKISRSDAVVICESLGFSTASRWDKAKMQKKMIEIQDMGSDMELDASAFDGDGKEYNRVNDLLDGMFFSSEQIEVISDTKYREISDNLKEEEGEDEEGPQEEEDEEDSSKDEEKEESPQEEIIEPKEEVDLLAIGDRADNLDEEAIDYLVELAAKKNITPKKYTSWTKVAEAIATGVVEESSPSTYRARSYELRRKTINVPERPRNTKSRAFLAGQVLRDIEMGPITVEVVEDLMERFGDENYRASRTMLVTSWQIIAGYLGKDLMEG